MLNVMNIVLGLQVGGLEKFVLDLVDKYPPDIKPIIVCLEGKYELGRKYDHLEIMELHKEPGIRLKIVRQLVDLVREKNIDIIHTHNPGPHFYGAVSGFLTGRPVVHTKHGRNYPNDIKKIWLNKLSSLLTKKIVPVSQNAADVCLEVEKIPPAKVTVILNGVDTNLFCAAVNKKVIDKRLVTIGIVARLSAEKDHQTLLKACKLLTDMTSNFHLEIIGDGPLRDTLETSVEELDLEPFVSFSGMRHDVAELLRKLDIFVLSSTTEGISLTLLEAMATELPVVATDVGGNPEVVIDGTTGYIVPSQNPDEMAKKLFLLINNSNLRRKMGSDGRKRVLEKFSITETAKKYEVLYRSVQRKK